MIARDGRDGSASVELAPVPVTVPAALDDQDTPGASPTALHPALGS